MDVIEGKGSQRTPASALSSVSDAGGKGGYWNLCEKSVLKHLGLLTGADG